MTQAPTADESLEMSPEDSPKPEARGSVWLLLVPVLVVLVWAVLPLVTGSKTLFMRDISSFHIPVKTFQAQAMREGTLPLLDAVRGGGQPLLGNPNTVPFYPDNLLFLLAETLWSINAHFWIHLLLAPLSMMWLARRWGLAPLGAAAAGTFWAVSGFFLSQMNFYNLIAGTALVPAFLASSLGLLEGRIRWWSVAVCALLWALLILGGDPILAAQAGLLLVLFVAVRVPSHLAVNGEDAGCRTSPPRALLLKKVALLGGALVGGVLLALPQLVEFFRILPLSYRGLWGFDSQSVLNASLNPVSVWEWFMPFAFGRPNFGFWGAAAFGDEGAPFFFSLFPGVIVLVCIAVSGRPRGLRVWGAWFVAGLGLFIAFGGYNPIMRLLVELPGFSLARYPVKFILLTAVAASLLAGRGFERIFTEGRTRNALQAVGLLVLVYLVTASMALNRQGWLAEQITNAAAAGNPLRVQQVLQNWLAMSVFLVLLLALFLAAVLLSKKRPLAGAFVLLMLHSVSQLFLMAPLLQMDETREFRKTPDSASLLMGKTVLHEESEAFGSDRVARKLPTGELKWLARQYRADLRYASGVGSGVRYELNQSPEGLDSFLNRSTLDSFRLLQDPERIQLARALGVNFLVLDRPLPLLVRGREALRLRHTMESYGVTMYVYEVLDPPAFATLASERWFAPHLNAAVEHMIHPDFDPLVAVAVPGEGEVSRRPPGRVELLRELSEGWVFEVDSEEGGVLLVQRAFHGIYEAFVDGAPVSLFATNVSRLGLDVPAGTHEVEIRTNRRPLRLSLVVSALAAILLLLAGRWTARAKFGAARCLD